MVLMCYSWLCTPKLLLAGSGDHLQCQDRTRFQLRVAMWREMSYHVLSLWPILYILLYYQDNDNGLKQCNASEEKIENCSLKLY